MKIQIALVYGWVVTASEPFGAN